MSSEPPFTKIGIVGLGLIGGSMALGIRRRWPQIALSAIDRPDAIDAALARQVIDRGSAELDAIGDVDLVVLAAPVAQNLHLVERLPEILAGNAVVTDTGSTKRGIVDAAAGYPSRLTFVGGHPLGGKATGGLAHASADLFNNRPWIFTPANDDSSLAVTQLAAIAEALGSTTHVMDAAAHDRLLAFVSHLPQMAASALMDVVGEQVGADALGLSGRGLADTTRLASSPALIWRDIASSNADQIGPALDILIARLQDLRTDLADGERLRETFERAARWRAKLPERI